MPHLRQKFAEKKPGKWDTFWRGVDRPTMRYELLGKNPETGQWRWEQGRAMQAVENYKHYLSHEGDRKSLDEWYVERLQAGQDLNFVRLNNEGAVQYYVPPQAFRLVSDNWLDVAAAGSMTEFPHEKSIDLLSRIIQWNTLENDYVLDFFAGSGSTGHAAVLLSRRFLLVEMGQYFEQVLLPRMLRCVREIHRPYSFKYIRLESYEDALNNLELKRTQQQASLLDADDELREQYLLSYMLDVESRGSQSLLNVDSFRDPDQYKLKVERNGETQLVNVDLVETFNWLLGLTVKHIDVIRGVRVVEGTNPEGERVLVLWRNLDETDNDALDEWFRKQDYNTKDQEYDLLYVNGDNNLENLRRGDQTWKVRLIEEEFQRLMFDVEDV